MIPPWQFIPHIFVWGSCFWLCIPVCPPARPPARAVRLSHTTLLHTALSHTTLSHTTLSISFMASTPWRHWHGFCVAGMLLTAPQILHTFCHPQHFHTQLLHGQHCHTHRQLCHTQSFTHTQPFHTQHCHTPPAHTTLHQHTHNIVTCAQLFHTHAHKSFTRTALSHATLAHTAWSQYCYTALFHFTHTQQPFAPSSFTQNSFTHISVTHSLSHTHTTLLHTSLEHT